MLVHRPALMDAGHENLTAISGGVLGVVQRWEVACEACYAADERQSVWEFTDYDQALAFVHEHHGGGQPR